MNEKQIKKLQEAKKILQSFELPEKQYNERSCLVFLSLANIKQLDDWNESQAPLLTTKEIMDFIKQEYGKAYATNTRESIRKDTLHYFEQAALIQRNRDDLTRATNSSKNNYSLNQEIVDILKYFSTDDWDDKIEEFKKNVPTLKKLYDSKLEKVKIDVNLLDGTTIKLSPGKHNQLHADIIHEFCPRFVSKNAEILYIGDTASSREEGGKFLHLNSEYLESLKIPPMSHDKLPDIVIHDIDNNWLFLIEAVTSRGPVSAKRWIELEDVCKYSDMGRVYITAFPDQKEFRRFAADIAWETEVWIADNPEHMIHFNGDRFLGPHS